MTIDPYRRLALELGLPLPCTQKAAKPVGGNKCFLGKSILRRIISLTIHVAGEHRLPGEQLDSVISERITTMG
jgi:hypothetical protein